MNPMDEPRTDPASSRSLTLMIVLVAAFGVGFFYAWVRLRDELRPPDKVSTTVPTAFTSHVVTPEMAEASRTMLDRPAPPFEVSASDGQTHRLDDLIQHGPLVLTFIKHGCPCSEAAQPFFNRIQAAYPEVSMRGVIDVEVETALSWAKQFQVSYPLLLDPDESLVRDYNAENSAYVVVVDTKGTIVQHWPGFSEGMLSELALQIAELAEVDPVPLNFSDAPKSLYSGCPYEPEPIPVSVADPASVKPRS